MNEDPRNIGLIGTCDGVPLFDDKHRGCWPFVFRVANLPDGLSHLMINSHVAIIAATEYFSLDPVTNELARWVRQPKSLYPHMLIIADDLYHGYHKGNVITDWSCRPGLAERNFSCRCMLLFWTGDYPAQGLASGFKHKGRRCCHWCTIDIPKKDKAMNRNVVASYRRFLPNPHRWRLETWQGALEERPPPEARTHASIMQHARENMEHTGAKCHAPHKSSGIKELCPLSYLQDFCLCWDFAPDMMHIVEGCLQNHIIPLMKGERLPAHPKRSQQKKELSKKGWAAIKRSWQTECVKATSWVVPDKTRKELDRRSRNLGGEQGWIRSGHAICRRTSSLKAHEWIKVAEGAWQYIFHGLYAEAPQQQESLNAFMSCLTAILQAYSHADFPNDPPDRSSERTNMIELKNKVVNAMALFDRDFPASEKAIMFHILLHVPDFMYKWGSARNGWCFYSERVMGWLIRFVKNRDLAVENMVTCLAKQSALCQVPPGVAASIRDRMQQGNIVLPRSSILKQASTVMSDRGSVPGGYEVSVRHTRYNTRAVRRPTPELKAAVRRLCTDLQISFSRVDMDSTKEMTAGVKINGRPYKAGSQCEIAKQIPRLHPEQADDASTFKVSTIHKFYTLQIDDEEFVLVEVSSHKKMAHYLNIRIVKKRAKLRRRIHSVDIIRTKVKFAPHWDEDITDLVCSVPVWSAT